MITLREYQQELVGRIRDAFRRGRRSPMVVAPTGSGKTVLFSYISHGTAAKGNRVLILVHRQELIDQTAKTLRAFGVPHGIIAAGRSGDRHQQVQVASVQTIVRRPGIFRPDLIIVDECHHASAGSWLKVIAANPQARILGFTATPERLDGKGLGSVFDEMILGPSVAWLIENGHLCKPRYFAPPVVADLSRIHMRGGDFAKDELASIMDSKAIIGDAVDHYRRICPGSPAIAFCVSVDHARHTAAQFQAAGFRAATIDGSMDREARRDIVAALADGRIHVMTSCEIVSEGFDIPLVTAAILLRPTASLGLHLQQIGRVLRPAPGKDRAIILDHVGNCGRHGYAETEREWSLEGRDKKKRAKQESSVEMRQCPSCYLCHEPAPICPECGHVYEIQRRELETVAGELVEIDPEIERRERKKEQGACQSMDDLIALGRKRGMRNPAGWARYVWQARQTRRSA
jgi:superfamily II DNA or RNA helicase